MTGRLPEGKPARPLFTHVDMEPDASLPESGPRRPLLWATLCSALATMSLAWPVLRGAFLVNPNSDQYLAGYAFREFAAQSLRSGLGFPQWNPFQFGGMPFVAAMHGDIFYPTAILRMVLPTDLAMTLGFVLHMIVAGVCTVGFLRASGAVPERAHRRHGVSAGRRRGLVCVAGARRQAFCQRAAAGGVVGVGARPARWLSRVVGMGWPFWLDYLRCLRTRNYCNICYLQLVHSRCLYCGRPLAVVSDEQHGARSQVITTSRGARLPWPVLVTRLTWAAFAVTLGAAISAIQYVPVREYTAWSPRAGGKGWDHAVSYSFPLEETINTYLPQFSGMLDGYWGRNVIHFHSEYLGASVLVLAGFAFGGGLLNRHLKHAWFWAGALIVALFWAWGGNTPFYQLVYAVVPGTKFFRAPSTALFVVSLANAVLAAMGAERLLARRGTLRYGVLWLAFALGVAAVASVGGFTDLALSIGGERADLISRNAASVTLGAWRSALFVMLTVGIVLAVRRGSLTASRAAWVLLFVVAIDLWSVSRRYWRFSAPAAELYAGDDIISFLKSQPQPVRVMALPLSDNMAFHDPFLTGDALMVHGVRGVLGYHGNELGRYQQLYGKDNDYRPLANPNFWALTNTQFLYTNVNTAPFQGARLVAGPVRNAAGTMTYLYDLPGAHPVAWVAPKVVRLGDDAARATILNPLFDVRRVAVFDSAAAVNAVPVDGPLPGALRATSVRSTRYDPGAIDLTIDGPVPSGSALVVSENFYPGWEATIDGAEVPVHRVDLSLIGIELPEGARSVSLRFASAPYQTGKIITLYALAAALTLVLGGSMLDRREALRHVA